MFFLLAIEISVLTSKDCCGLGFFYEELGQLMHFPAKYIYEAAVL